MGKQWQHKFVGAVVLVALAACDQHTDPVQPAGPQASASEVPAAGFRNLHEYFDGLGARIPGFAGWYFDGEGNPTVLLVDLDRSALAQQLIAPEAEARRVYRKDGSTPPAAFRFVQARFSFRELREWQQRVRPIFSLPGVIETGIDEVQNKVVLGVESAGRIAAVRAHALELGIPAEALLVEVSLPLLPRADNDSLTSRVRLVPGGVQAGFVRFGPHTGCTMMANVIRAGVRAFLVNSHCTEQFGAVTSTTVHQPYAGYSADSHIGTETEDRTPWTGSNCPYSWPDRCRWSDAAIVTYTDATLADPARLARTTYWSAFRGASGSRVIDQSNPRLNLVGTVSYPVNGEHLDKMGRTTGWTYGDVFQTCRDRRQANLADVVLRCQDLVYMGSGGGDSGSPVFRNPSGGANAYLYGILWGGGSTDGRQYIVFSAISNIEGDYGTIGWLN